MVNATQLKIAIVGAGPGGLGTAIALRELSGVQVSIFDQASELKEIGAGISINANTWRVLRILRAADHLSLYHDKVPNEAVIDSEHRNGNTGELLARKYQNNTEQGPPRARIERYKLQQALLSRLPEHLVQLGKRLSKLEPTTNGGILLRFTDLTTEGPFDLVIGADGIRSTVRQHAFPDHKLSYTGKVAYRTLIPQEKVAHIKGIPPASCFWHTPTTHVYTCPLDNGLFEIATRATESEDHAKKVSWGRPVTKDHVVKHYEGYCETIRQIVDAPDEWLEFAMFGGPRLDSVVHGGNIALIGDASHPLSGAFGSGAAFALEDAYTLGSAIAYAQTHRRTLAHALHLFDTTRAGHYKNLYNVLEGYGRIGKELSDPTSTLTDDEKVKTAIDRNWKAGSTTWIYEFDVTAAWAETVAKQQKSSESSPA